MMDSRPARGRKRETRAFSPPRRANLWAGIFLAGGMTVYLAVMFLSQFLTSGYSMVNDDISSLGKGPAAIPYNASVVVAGIGAIVCGSLIVRARGKRLATVLVSLLLVVLGLAVAAGGIFPEGTDVHLQVGLVAFFLSGLTPIATFPLQRGWSAYFSVVAGTVTLAMVVLTLANVTLPVADGIKERITLFPAFTWAIVFGARLALGMPGR